MKPVMVPVRPPQKGFKKKKRGKQKQTAIKEKIEKKEDEEIVEEKTVREAEPVEDQTKHETEEREEKEVINDEMDDKIMTIPPKIRVNRSSKIALLRSVAKGELGKVEQELEVYTASELPTLCDTAGRTVLHVAVFYGYIKICRRIMEHPQRALEQEREKRHQVLLQRYTDIRRWGTPEDIDVYREWMQDQKVKNEKELMAHQHRILHDLLVATDIHERTVFHYLAVGKLSVYDSALGPMVYSKSLLRKMHCRDTFDWSPLQYAAHEGNIPAIKWFFQGLRTTNSVMEPTMLSTILQCSSNAFTKKVITAQVKCSVIADTSSSNDAAMVSILEQYEDLDARDGARLQAPLHKMTEQGNVSAVQYLIERGVDINSVDANGWSALHYCAQKSTDLHFQIAALLLKARDIQKDARNTQGRTPLHLAVQKKDVDIGQNNVSKLVAKLLLESGAEMEAVDHHSMTPLLLCCAKGNSSFLQLLLEASCNLYAVNDRGENAMHVAAASGHINTVRMLSSWDVEHQQLTRMKNCQNKTPFAVALNAKTRFAMNNLWCACFNGDVDHVLHFLKFAKRNASTSLFHDEYIHLDSTTPHKRYTALHLTMEGLYKSLSGLRNSALPDTRRIRNNVVKKYATISSKLLKRGCSADFQDSNGTTALMLAAAVGEISILEFFIGKDAIVDDIEMDVVDYQGNTALHYSYAYSQGIAARFLESNGANDEIRNDAGCIPFDVTGMKSKIKRME